MFTLIFALSACTPTQAAQWLNANGANPKVSANSQEARDHSRLFTAYWRVIIRQHQQQSNLIYKWQGVANCESGGNWSINTGNGYYGGVQFLLSTWRSVGGQGYPHQNSAYEQAYRAEILKNRAGLGQWPHCGRYYRG